MKKNSGLALAAVFTGLLLFGLYIVLTQYEKPVYELYTLPTEKALDTIEGRINF